MSEFELFSGSTYREGLLLVLEKFVINKYFTNICTFVVFKLW
ncbi:MAG: hypothetical protein ABIM42_05315 [candidate division WOR-3 bacterium]